MELVYNVIVPILASLIGGLVGGLFTFLGIRMILLKDKKLNEEIKAEKNKEVNNVIKGKRPELTLTQNPFNIVAAEEIYLIPYMGPVLKDEKTIKFKYTDEIFKDDYWDKYEIILENTGKREVQSMFLLLGYKCGANIYSKDELLMWKQTWMGDYYQDELNLFARLKPEEKMKLIIHFPKEYDKLANIPIDLYMYDEDGNYWCQNAINLEFENKSEVIAPDAYDMHIRQEYYQWFIYDHMYYSDKIKKLFSSGFSKMSSILEDRKRKCWDREEKQRQYVWDVNNGKIVLKHNYPISEKN